MSKTIEKEIWPPYQAFYIHSMLFNSEAAVASIEKISAVMHEVEQNSPDDPVSALPMHYLLGELQNLLIHAAALSRYFWPARNTHDWRGAQLRGAFGISDQSPLRSRDLRNAIEHFDEQLDKYVEGGIVGNIHPQYVGPRPNSNGVPLHLFRAYFTDTAEFELLGKRYTIMPIAEAVLNIHRQLMKMDQNGSMLSAGEKAQ